MAETFQREGDLNPSLLPKSAPPDPNAGPITSEAHVVATPGVATAPPVDEPVGPIVSTAAEERVSVASQWQLMWWRFRKHRLAMLAAVIVALFYVQVLAADFLAYAD